MRNAEFSNLPRVSVIVAVYNAEKNVRNLLESLANLDYPKELLEVIIVDNNSKDKTREIVRQYPVKLLEETKIQSSYAARNKGIRNANGKILAFLDSDCIAKPGWIREGVKSLISQSADLAGGKIEFFYPKNGTIAELYDSMTSLQNELYVKTRNSAVTANLFVKPYLFEKIGGFFEMVKSGGDMQWTSKATLAGFRLVYAPEAVVMHPARELKALIKKNFRVGTGLLDVWISRGASPGKCLYFVLRRVLWQSPAYPGNSKKEKKEKYKKHKIVGFFFISYLCRIARFFGLMRSLFNKKR